MLREFVLPCCAGWHVSWLRAEVGSYHEWLLLRIREMANA